MRHIHFLVFLAASGFLLVSSCTMLRRAERVNLAAYNPDYRAVSGTDRVTRSLTIRSKDGVLMYHHIYEEAKPIENGIPGDMMSMTEYIAKNILQCRKPTTNDELAMLRSYRIPMQGLDDCVVIYMAEKASAEYLDDDASGLLLWSSASKLYRKLGQKKIYESFLAGAYMQNDMWGMASASDMYFGKDLTELEPTEKLWLMALLTLGNTPDKDEQAFAGRMSDLAAYMRRKGAVGYNEPIPYVPYQRARTLDNYPFYDSLVLSDLELRNIEPKGELKVLSGLNLAMTQAAEDAIVSRLPKMPEGIEVAMAVVNVRDGSVEALAATSRTKFRTLHMKRQIGSTFKPIVYLTAFANGIAPNELIDDKKYDYKNHGQPYSPSNYDDYYMGVIPLRKGLVNSLNNATIRLAKLTGLPKVAETAKAMGMEYNVRPYLAMPLGIFPLTVLNVAKVYSVLGGMGVRKDVSFIDDIMDGSGQKVAWERFAPERIVPAANAYQTLYIMQDVVRKGTARGSGIIEGTSAKTGTTDDSKDVWTASVFYPYVAVVWAGFDDRRSMGEKATGGGIAAPVIAAFQRNILPGVQKIDLNVPQGIVFKRVDNGRGAVVGDGCPSERTYLEAFAAGNVPPECAVRALEPIIPQTEAAKESSEKIPAAETAQPEKKETETGQ